MSSPDSRQPVEWVEHTDASQELGVKIEPHEYRIYEDKDSPIRYAKNAIGAHLLHRLDSDSGKWAPISSNKYLKEWGYEPQPSEPRPWEKPPGMEPTPGGLENRLKTLEGKLDGYEAAIREIKDAIGETDNRYKDRFDTIDRKLDELKSTRAPEPEPGQPPGQQPPEQAPNQQPQPQTPEQQALAAAEIALNEARDILVWITIRRKGRTTFTEMVTSSGRGDRAAYMQALNHYQQMVNNYQIAHRNLLQADMQNQNLTPEELRSRLGDQMMRDTYLEEIKLNDREFEINNEQLDQIGWVGRFLRRYANLSTKKKVFLGLTVGGLTALASGPLGLGLAGALAIGIPARFSLGLLNKRVSLRNVSERSRSSIQQAIEQRRDSAITGFSLLHFNTDQQLENFRLVRSNEVRSFHEGNTQWGRRRQNIGAVAVGLSLVPIGYGAANLAGAGLPDFHISRPFGWFEGGNEGPGFPRGRGGGSLENLPDNFHPDSFRGSTSDEAVANAMDVFRKNNINVEGLTPDRIHAISQELANVDWKIASGVDATGNQNIVDWPAGQTANANASAMQGFEKINGSSIGNWERFMDAARRHGIRFTREQ